MPILGNGTWSATYDNIIRLTGTSFTPAGSGTAMSLAWTYDNAGNRTSQTGAGGYQTSTIDSATNRITASTWSNTGSSGNATFTYDASGNVTYDGQNYYLYDAEGQLCASQRAIGGTITQYIYDGDGNRVAKGYPTDGSTTLACADPTNMSNFTATTIYAANQEYDGDGVTLQRTYVNGATINADGSVHYQFGDWLGNRRMEVTSAGVVEGTYQNLPFGDGLSVAGDDSDHEHFTGKERDDETSTAGGHDGLDYFGARYDSSNIGRWTQPDWSAKEEPIPYSKIDNPQSLNLYAYVGNNPLTGVDADGHFSQWETTVYNLEGAEQQSDAIDEADAERGDDDDEASNGSGYDPNSYGDSISYAYYHPTRETVDIATIPLHIRNEMATSAIKADQPTSDDVEGGFHEESGVAGTDASAAWHVAWFKPGPYGNPDKQDDLRSSYEPVNSSLMMSISGNAIFFHAHPSGRTQSNRFWEQKPSPDDYKAAEPGVINILFTSGTKNVIFYNQKGPIGKPIKIKDFIK